MLLFWKQGYESTSISDLTRELRITPPSLYAAFGDKRRLFLEALARYLSGPVTSASIIDGAPTARKAASDLLETSAIAFTGPHTPAGCLLASSAISCSPAAADVQAELATIRRDIEARLSARITRGITLGELPGDCDAETLAAQVTAVIQGMSTLARDGATREKLLRIVELTMRGWPGATSAQLDSASQLA